MAIRYFLNKYEDLANELMISINQTTTATKEKDDKEKNKEKE